MAIVVSTLVGEAVYAGSQTRTTASNVAIGANELGLLFIVYKRDANASPPGSVTGISQTGATWEVSDATYGALTYHTAATPTIGMAVWRCMPTSAVNATAQITISGTTQAVWNYYFLKATGVATGANGANAIRNVRNNRADSPVNSLTVTLPALGDATNNAVVALFGGSNDNVGTPGGSYIELFDQTSNNADSAHGIWLLPGTTTPSYTLSNQAIGGIALELVDAGGGGGVGIPVLLAYDL